jgi:hypothetical protein
MEVKTVPLAQFLTDAGNAIADARTHIHGSSNRRSDRIQAAGGIDAIVAARTGTDATLLNAVGASRAAIGPTLVGAPAVDTVQIRNGAIASGVGNCHELAAVAYEWLRATAVTPIELMRFTAAGYDHVWVVIGRVAGSDLTNLRTWGADAVWCDPWQGDAGVAFGIQSFVRGEVRNLNAIYRCNTVELVEAGVPAVITSA